MAANYTYFLGLKDKNVMWNGTPLLHTNHDECRSVHRSKIFKQNQIILINARLTQFLAQIWAQETLRHILGPILVIFEICQFLMIPGPFEYFSENGWSQKIKVFLMKEQSLPPYRFSFRRRGP